jgi:hypothetical protein
MTMKYYLEYKPAGKEAPMLQELTEYDFSEICMADLRSGNEPVIEFTTKWGEQMLVVKEK